MLGIHNRCTPQLASEISILTALMSSLEETQKVLKDTMGVKLAVNRIRKLAYSYAERARLVQQSGEIPVEETCAGQSKVISLDGGRIRLRENKRGPKTSTGRTRYKAAWREPKLLMIYVVNTKGQLEKSFTPFIDGLISINDPDAIFRLLLGYLQQLQITLADLVLFVADAGLSLYVSI